MTAITDFPLELINHIIDNLRQHKPSLASASLTSRTWTPRARYHLFRDIGRLPGGYGLHRMNRFVELCTNECSTIPNAGPRVLSITSPLPYSDALCLFTEAFLKDDLAKKVFWNVEELTITYSKPDEWTHFDRLIDTGCFSRVKKLKMVHCTSEGIPKIMRSFGRLEDVCLDGTRFISSPVRGDENKSFSLCDFPKSLRRLTLLVDDKPYEPANALQLFCGCSTLEEIVVDCASSGHVKEIEYFLEHSTASIRRMTLRMGLCGVLSDDIDGEGIAQLKKIISVSSSRVEDVVIEGYMDRLCYMFSDTAEGGNTPPRNFKTIILMPEVEVRQEHVQMFEAMIEKNTFFHGLSEIHLQLLVWVPNRVMDEAGWDEETQEVMVGSASHRCGQKELMKSLSLFNEKAYTKTLLRPSVKYEIMY